MNELPTKEETRVLLIYAFRYALGRRSSAPSDISSMVINFQHLLQNEDVRLIIKDAEQAIAGGFAGDKCDVDVWNKMIDALKYKAAVFECSACGCLSITHPISANGRGFRGCITPSR